MACKILRRVEVLKMIGVSRSSLYEMISKGLFPKPIQLGPRSVGWLSEEIESWLVERVAQRDGFRKGA